MTIDWGGALSKTHFDADTDDPSQARADLEAMVDRLNARLATKTLLETGDKTGVDAKIVSGTAGVSGNLVEWNADGDAVDSGQAISGLVMQVTSEVAAVGSASVEFTGVSGYKRITLIIQGLSFNTGDHVYVQIGDSGGYETSGYQSDAISFTSAGAHSGGNNTSAFWLPSTGSADIFDGVITLEKRASDREWVCSGLLRSGGGRLVATAGNKPLSAALDRVRVKGSASNNFGAGSILLHSEA